MVRHVLYAYVDGSNLDGIADALDSRFAKFVENRSWVAGRASVVNQKEGDETSRKKVFMVVRSLTGLGPEKL
jgi:hypothetical protein